jgi:hypothetical protein
MNIHETSYIYQPLGNDEIRVFRLDSCDPDIRGTIRNVPLSSNPEYKALSYVWGSSMPADCISVGSDSSYIQITENLSVCLRHLGSHIGSDIWIDAICINQGDDEEKSRCVNRMADIYAGATLVLIWLGPEANNSGVAMSGLALHGKRAYEAGIFRMSREAMQRWPDVGVYPELVQVRDTLIELAKEASEASFNKSLRHERFPRIEFARLAQREYFKRVWVKQELTVAPRALVICGNDTMPIEHFDAGYAFQFIIMQWELAEYASPTSERQVGGFTLGELRAAPTPWDLTKQTIPPSELASLLRDRRNYQRGEAQPALFQLLRSCYIGGGKLTLDCQDPRDRIYGLLGITADIKEMDIIPDYSLSAMELYEDATRAIVKQGNLDVLTYCRTRDLLPPTWVPDWSCPQRTTWSDDGNASCFRASGPLSQPPSPTTYATSRGIIELHGAYIDTISLLGSRWEASLDQTFDLAGAKVMFQEVNSFLRKSRYSEHERSEASWRIPIGDKEMTSSFWARATASCKELYSLLASSSDDAETRKATSSYSNMMGYMYDAVPFLSSSGYVGLCPFTTQGGDVICIFLGGSVPFVLRPGSYDGYMLVGEVYVHGIMDGEFFHDDISTRTFKVY